MVNNEVIYDVKARVAQLEQQLNNLYGPSVRIQLSSTVSLGGPLTDIEFILEVRRLCCLVLGCTTDEFVSNRRNRHLVMARQLFYKIVRENQPHTTYVRLGELAGKDHTTVTFGMKAIDDLLSINHRPAVLAYQTIVNQLKHIQHATNKPAQVQA